MELAMNDSENSSVIFLIYFRFIATKHLLNRFQVTRISLLPQTQLMPPPEEVAVPCSQQLVSSLSHFLFYIFTVRDSGQGTSLLPHLLDPPPMITTSPVWPRRNRSTSKLLSPHLNRKHWEFMWRVWQLVNASVESAGVLWSRRR